MTQGKCRYGGSAHGYNQGCRCDECRAASSEYKRQGRLNGAAWVTKDRTASRDAKRRRRAAGERI